MLTGPDQPCTSPKPECLLDVLLVDLPETGTVDWDALGFGCREPFYSRELNARRKKPGKTGSKTGRRQLARAA